MRKRKARISRQDYLNRSSRTTYRGKFSASSRTTLIPSRARADAEYDPAGPPPMTKTDVSSGMDILLAIIGKIQILSFSQK